MAYRDKDNRKKKSWREIDRGRDSSQHRSREDNSPREKKRQHSTAYQNYKSDLDKLFTGGDVPDYLKNMMPEAESNADPGQLKLLGAIHRATSASELTKSVDEYLAGYDEFPDDIDLLARVLDHPNENVQLLAVRQIDRIQREQPLAHKQQFILKLDSISMMADDDDLRELAEELLARLR